MCIGNLSRRSPVNEREEGPTLIAVAGQCREPRETHLLGHIVRRSEASLLPSNSGAAVPHHKRTNGGQQAFDRLAVAVDGRAHFGVQSVPQVGHRRQQPWCYLLAFRHRTTRVTHSDSKQQPSPYRSSGLLFISGVWTPRVTSRHAE